MLSLSKLIVASLILLCRPAYAIRAVMEGVAASSNTVFVDTVSIRLDIGTITYSGGIPGVSLFSSSNVVISSGTGGNNYFISYATGSVLVRGTTDYNISLSSGLRFFTPKTGIKWADGSVSTTASSGASSTSLNIATGPSTGVGSTQLTSQATLYFDSLYFTAASSPTIGSNIISLSTGSANQGWTRQTFLSGSGTYNSPSTAIQIRVTACGGGGGGGSTFSGGTAGSSGGSTIFGSTTAAGGGGGDGNAGSHTYMAGGIGGSSGVSSFNLVRLNGQNGGPGNGITTTYTSGYGGSSALFGGGAAGVGSSNNASLAGQSGVSGSTNTGGGGSGGIDTTGPRTSAGGGGGECVEIVINSPSASYSYTVGSGGSAGTGGSFNGGPGASGIVIVDELYPAIGPQGPQGPTGASTGGAGWTSIVPQVYLTTATNNVIVQSTLTVQGSQFSVGGSSFSVSNPGGFNVVSVGTTSVQSISQDSTEFNVFASSVSGAGSNAITINLVGSRSGASSRDASIVLFDNTGNAMVMLGRVDFNKDGLGSAGKMAITMQGSAGGPAPSSVFDSSGSVHLGTISGTQIYRCSGGSAADSGALLYGNSGVAQTACTVGGGTLTAVGTYFP